MGILNQEATQEIVRLTWRNPFFMAIAIAMIWLIPQLLIRKIFQKFIKKLNLKNKKIRFISYILKLLNKNLSFRINLVEF